MFLPGEIEATLVLAGQKVETCAGREVEGLVRPTTDRQKLEKVLEVLAMIITSIRQILAGLNAGQSSDPCKPGCGEGGGKN